MWMLSRKINYEDEEKKRSDEEKDCSVSVSTATFNVVCCEVWVRMCEYVYWLCADEENDKVRCVQQEACSVH